LTLFKGEIVIFGYQLTSGLQLLGLMAGCLHIICFGLCLSVTRERPRPIIPVHSSLFGVLIFLFFFFPFFIFPYFSSSFLDFLLLSFLFLLSILFQNK